MKVLATCCHGYVACEVLWGPLRLRPARWRVIFWRGWLLLGWGIVSIGFGYWRRR